MEHPMMKCGHAANAMHQGKPSCVICVGIVPGWDEVADSINLKGRMAKCHCNKQTRPSNTELAFFEHRPTKEFDSYYSYYCGHSGWD